MMTRLPRLLPRLTWIWLMCLLLPSLAQAQGGRHFLWTVKSGTRTLYLAGSLHALSPDVYPLPEAYDRAFAAADTLVEEVDLATMQTLDTGMAALTRGLLTGGRTLESVVGRETWTALSAHAERYGMPAHLLQPFEPWMAVMMLSAFGTQQAGLDPSLGLDQHFYDRARAARKPVRGLETVDSQLARLDALPDSVQVQLLRATLAGLDTEQRQLASLVAAWRTGDHATIERMTLKDLAAQPAIYRTLIVERNHNWLPALDACLVGRTCFVVVGAAHLVGPDGLLALLRQKGYTIAQQ
jgi:uncharacterized protein YbaP (TraB family)